MKKYIFTAALALSLLTGCKDFLTEEPVLSQSDVLTLSTYEGLDKVTAGAYAPLASTAWYGGDFIIINEMKTGNGKKYIGSDFDTGRCTDWYNINYTPDNTSSLWGYGYYVITTANNVINNLEGKSDNQQDLDNLKAECLFLRALSHFDLVRTYAQPYNYTEGATHLGVPVITTVQSASDMPERETVAKVYGQIEADLLEAEKIIDPAYTRAGVKDTRSVVSLEAIQALLSRVYLYMGNWQGCADYATKVINSNKFSMWTADDLSFVNSENAAERAGNYENFVYCFDSHSDGEVIFEVYGTTGQSYGGGNEAICSLTSENQYGDAGACADLMDLYDEGDVRGTMFQSKLSGKDNRTVYWTAKYFGKGLTTPDYTNTIVLRLSEMYLNRAEAIYNGASISGVSTSSPDIRMITSNRGAADIPNPSISDIYEERRKELAWEGHEWFDLARTGRTMTRTDSDANAAANEVRPGDTRWAMPIPRRETTVNDNLEQNPGY